MLAFLYHTDEAKYRPLPSDSPDQLTDPTESTPSLEDGLVMPRRRKGRRRGYFICGSIWALTIL